MKVVKKHLDRQPRENKTLRFLREKDLEERAQEVGTERLQEVVTSVISTTQSARTRSSLGGAFGT